MSRKNCVRMGMRAETALEVEDPMEFSCMTRGYFSVRVHIVVREPLVEGFWFPGRGCLKYGSLFVMRNCNNFSIVVRELGMT